MHPSLPPASEPEPPLLPTGTSRWTTPRRHAWLSIGVAAALAVGVWWWTQPRRAAPVAPAPSTERAFPWDRAPDDVGAGAEAPPVAASGAAALALPGVQTDAKGHVLPSTHLRELFDRLLGSRPREPQAVLGARTQLRELLVQRLPLLAQEEAEALLTRYGAYRAEAIDVEEPLRQRSASTEDQMMAIEQIERLRAHHFSAQESAGLFGHDLVVRRYAMARVRLWRNHDQPLLATAQQLDALRTTLGAALAQNTARADAQQDLDMLTTQWRARRGHANELHALRETLIGAPATAELEREDQRSAAVRPVIESLGQRIRAVSSDPSLSDVQRQAAIEQLRQEAQAALLPMLAASQGRPSAITP